MNETVIMNNTLLAQVKDIIFNIRTEVKEIQPLKENVEKLKTEISRLKRETRKYEESIPYLNKCRTCGKPSLLEFKVCPYCGENIKLLPEKNDFNKRVQMNRCTIKRGVEVPNSGNVSISPSIHYLPFIKKLDDQKFFRKVTQKFSL